MLLHLLGEVFPRAGSARFSLFSLMSMGLVFDPGLPGFLGDVP